MIYKLLSFSLSLCDLTSLQKMLLKHLASVYWSINGYKIGMRKFTGHSFEYLLRCLLSRSFDGRRKYCIFNFCNEKTLFDFWFKNTLNIRNGKKSIYFNFPYRLLIESNENGKYQEWIFFLVIHFICFSYPFYLDPFPYLSYFQYGSAIVAPPCVL